jgi:hypothetical protein
MIRALLKLALVVVVIVVAVAFFFGYRFGMDGDTGPASEPTAVGTGGIDTQRVRERGAQIGEAVAGASQKAAETISDAGLTAKIKSKMALDDLVKARTINVDSADGVVTLTGQVRSEQERQRALALARETNGVTSVVDRLQIR